MTRRRSISPTIGQLVVAAALTLVSCSSDGITGTAGSWKAGTDVHQIVVGPLTRSYLLHVPARRPISSAGIVLPYPLLIVLHGSSGSAADIRRVTKMDSLSETARFLVAYPSGVQGGGGLYPSDWNAGLCCGAAGRENVDDVGFISAVISEAGKKLTLDRQRIYVIGFSDGGRMAHHLACRLSPTIAAIGVVSGSLKDDGCAPAKAVAVIAIHGTSDDQVPYDEAALTAPSRLLTGVATTLPTSVQFWLAADGCGAGMVNRMSTNVVRTSFASCTGAEVAFYTIEGGTHAWPGAGGSQPPMSELAASIVMSQFLSRQYRR
jgi:polyhydroxybutyrate depolymerase